MCAKIFESTEVVYHLVILVSWRPETRKEEADVEALRSGFEDVLPRYAVRAPQCYAAPTSFSRRLSFKSAPGDFIEKILFHTSSILFERVALCNSA